MLPELSEEHALLVRTDFSDDAAWHELCTNLQDVLNEIHAVLVPVDDPRHDGLTPAGLAELVVGPEPDHAFLADHGTFDDPRRLLVAVDLYETRGRAVRVTREGLLNVQAYLTAGTATFDEIAERWTPELGTYPLT